MTVKLDLKRKVVRLKNMNFMRLICNSQSLPIVAEKQNLKFVSSVFEAFFPILAKKKIFQSKIKPECDCGDRVLHAELSFV